MKMKKKNLFNVNGLAVAIGAIGLSLIAATFSSADVCDDAQNPVEYDSTDGDEPNVTSDWSFTCLGEDGNDYATITNGILIIDDTSTAEKAKYCDTALLFSGLCDPRQDAVYEFSCKALEVETNAESWEDTTARFVFVCGMGTGSNGTYDHDFRVAVTLNEGVGFFEVDGEGDAIWLNLGSGDLNIDIPQTGGTNSPWVESHTFRVEKNDTDVKLFVDNEDTASITIDLDDLPQNYLVNEAKLLSTSIPGRCEFELRHFRYRIASTNFNEPASSTCLGDVDGDDDVDIDDLIAVLAEWGPCIGCDEDINDDDVVGLTDLKAVLLTWGLCVP